MVRRFRWPIVATVALALLSACGDTELNFSQYAGFAAYFAAHPRAQTVPAEADQALLARYRPRLFLPPGHPGLIDFYADYVAQGALYDGAGRMLSSAVTRELLNARRSDPRAVFVHRPTGAAPRGTVYGRIDREAVPRPGGTEAETLTFLTYNAVFRTSGLPAGLPWLQEAALGLVASLDDWHQLDHYTAATLALDGRMRPMALTLQQHNHVRTYLIGRDVVLPPDGRVELDVAIRSNELYPHSGQRVRHRTIGMPTATNLRYLISGERPPFFVADDVTHGSREADFTLAFLPPADAFYSFEGFLGERRRLPGRDGPPGADYNTLPGLKGKAMQMLAGYFRDADDAALAALASAQAEAHVDDAFAQTRAADFFRDRACMVEPATC